MSITCTWTFRLHSDAGNDGVAEAVDAVMEQLLALEDGELGDSAIGLDLNAMTAEVSVTVRGLDYEQVLPRALATIRAAIHASGGYTASWPASDVPAPHGLQFEPAHLTAA